MGLAAAVSAPASAQATFSLKDCMAYAISHSTKVRIQQAAAGDAQIARRMPALSSTIRILPRLEAIVV